MAAFECTLTGLLGHPMLCPFFVTAAKVNLGVVIVGGLIGGLLQPIYAQLDHNHENPSYRGLISGPLFGIAAAGVSVYLFANSRTDQPIHLLFFAIISGLAFPSILTQAIERHVFRGQNVKDALVRTARDAESDDLESTAKASEQAKRTLAQNPARDIGVTGVSGVVDAGQVIVRNIAQTATNDPSTAPSIVNELQQVGAVAKAAGYVSIAKTAAEELNKVAGQPIDDTIKALAREAAAGLLGK